MLVYILLLGFICFDFWLEHYLTKKGTLSKETKFTKFLNFVFKYRVLTIFALVFISTFRDLSVGSDNPQYSLYYETLKESGTFQYKFELGYMSLNYILARLLKLDIRALFFVISLFVSICLVLFINKFSCNKLMSFLLFVMFGVFGQSLGVLRQIVSVGFVLISLIFIADKKLWRGALMIALAALFHSTALLCFIIIPIRFIKLNHWWVFGALIACCLFAFSLPFVLQLIETIVPRFDYYSRYYILHPEMFQKTNLFNILYTVAMIAIYTVLYLARYKWFKEELENDKSFTFFLTLFTIVPLIRIAGLIIGLEAVLNRINMYFFSLLIVLVPRFMKCLKKYNHNGWLYFGMYIAAFAYMILVYSIHDSCGVVPYIFWF